MIPAYNESARIGGSLERLLAHIAQRGWNAEVLVVNDGSRDDTVQIVQRYARENPQVRVIENPGNRGKGFSVRNGILQAGGETLLFSDADFSSPLKEADKLFAALASGYDVAIGSRWLRAELQKRRQPLYRQLLGRIFNLALRVILGLKFKDTQCGFKAFTRTAAHAIFPLQQIERWGFDAEILFLASQLGFRTAEVAVEWEHSPGTRISPLKDGLRMFLEMLKVRWYSVSGRYHPKR